MPPQLAAVLKSVDGWKTYGLAALLVLLAVLDVSGNVPAEQRMAVYAAVSGALIAAVRHALSKLPDETRAKLVQLRDLLNRIGDQLPPVPPSTAPPTPPQLFSPGEEPPY